MTSRVEVLFGCIWSFVGQSIWNFMKSFWRGLPYVQIFEIFKNNNWSLCWALTHQFWVPSYPSCLIGGCFYNDVAYVANIWFFVHFLTQSLPKLLRKWKFEIFFCWPKLRFYFTTSFQDSKTNFWCWRFAFENQANQFLIFEQFWWKSNQKIFARIFDSKCIVGWIYIFGRFVNLKLKLK